MGYSKWHVRLFAMKRNNVVHNIYLDGLLLLALLDSVEILACVESCMAAGGRKLKSTT